MLLFLLASISRYSFAGVVDLIILCSPPAVERLAINQRKNVGDRLGGRLVDSQLLQSIFTETLYWIHVILQGFREESPRKRLSPVSTLAQVHSAAIIGYCIP